MTLLKLTEDMTGFWKSRIRVVGIRWFTMASFYRSRIRVIGTRWFAINPLNLSRLANIDVVRLVTRCYISSIYSLLTLANAIDLCFLWLCYLTLFNINMKSFQFLEPKVFLKKVLIH